jgi:hypothetical protein
MSEKIYHAWYSAKQAKVAGTIFYRKLDGSGEVEVSMVGRHENEPPKWPDAVYLGLVCGFVKAGQRGDLIRTGGSFSYPIRFRP